MKIAWSKAQCKFHSSASAEPSRRLSALSRGIVGDLKGERVVAKVTNEIVDGLRIEESGAAPAPAPAPAPAEKTAPTTGSAGK